MDCQPTPENHLVCKMEKRVFHSSVNPVTGTLLVFIALFLMVTGIFVLAEDPVSTGDIIASVVMFLSAILCIWLLLDTKYTITGKTVLFYCSGPIRGKIDIGTIRKIEHQRGWISTSLLKPSLDKDGLYIHYNKFDDIYLSPKDKEAFVNYLLKINPKIDII